LLKERPAGMIADLKANSTTTAHVKVREDTMTEQDSPPGVDSYRIAEIVSGYLRHQQIRPMNSQG